MVFVWVVEIDLVFVYGPKMTWFCMGIEIDLVFVWVDEIDLMSAWEIEVDLILVKGSELNWFCVGVGNDLVLVSGSKLLCRGI